MTAVTGVGHWGELCSRRLASHSNAMPLDNITSPAQVAIESLMGVLVKMFVRVPV